MANAEDDPRNCWAYFVRPSRPTFIEDRTEVEEEVVGRHFLYLKGLLDDGRLIIAGPCIDGKGPGVIVFDAADEADARRTMEGDPAVAAGVFSAELHPFKGVAVEGSGLAGDRDVWLNRRPTGHSCSRLRR